MNNAMQLKARIGALSRKTGVPHQIILQNYMMERLLARIAASRHADAFVLKGGFLLSSVFGIAQRTTMDMDVTLCGLPVREAPLRSVLSGICAIDLGDGVSLELRGMEEIREGDQYEGWRPTIHATFPPVSIMLKMDITAGDSITPGAVRREIPLLLEPGAVAVRSYPFETVLAEKTEAILSRAEANTRMRDFYDASTLLRLRGGEISRPVFADALRNTARRRGSSAILGHARRTLADVAASAVMNRRWDAYQASNPYSSGLSFARACSDVVALLSESGVIPEG